MFFSSYWLTYVIFFVVIQIHLSKSTELVIPIAGNLIEEGSTYRLGYYPSQGYPPPDTIINSQKIHDSIQISQLLPTTEYEFKLYYSNSTISNILIWTMNITTTPDPPFNLSVTPKNGKSVLIVWNAPLHGQHSAYRINFFVLTKLKEPFKTVNLDGNTNSYILKDLMPGASYQVKVFTIFDSKESITYTSKNFTIKPNSPLSSIVWYRNETTLIVLWQPPIPAGIFEYYKVSIEPPEATESVLYVVKEGNPPQPAQAAFKRLFPGRAYNITAQTVSENAISEPKTVQYRTVPLKPGNITFDRALITSQSFRVHWNPPNGYSEFDKYQVSVTNIRKMLKINQLKVASNWLDFNNLEPGRTYTVDVRTVSGKVTSWPTAKSVTLPPLPVQNLTAMLDVTTKLIQISWIAHINSFQEGYLISHHEVGRYNGDSDTITTNETHLELEILPGRNYSISVQAISKEIESTKAIINVVTPPNSPAIHDLTPLEEGLKISWISDVETLKDKYELQIIRNDTGESHNFTLQNTMFTKHDLYPGALYLVQICAISNGIKSDTNKYFQPIFPRPPRNVIIDKVTNNSIIVQWQAPVDSLFSEYIVRYRTDTTKEWSNLPNNVITKAEIVDIIPGERYIIEVNTVSYDLESNEPQQINHTVPPSAVSNVNTKYVDSNNVTLEWPRPKGRVEFYWVQWWPTLNPEETLIELVIQNNTNNNGPIIDPITLSIKNLIPEAKYIFNITAVSNNLSSDHTLLYIQTMPFIQRSPYQPLSPQQPLPL